jgi:uncharacterized protein
MNLKSRALSAISAAVAIALVSFAAPAIAQDAVADSHLKAARAAVSAIRATEDFDKILPQAAAALKTELIAKNPDLQEIIIQTVDEQALALAARRADLEKEAALAYAKVFSEDDLNAIATFYTSDTGKKLLESGPIVTRELFKAADIWQRGIARDLSQGVGAKLAAVIKSQAPDPTQPQATDPAQPAPDQPAPEQPAEAPKQ